MKMPPKNGIFFEGKNFALKFYLWITISYFYDSIYKIQKVRINYKA